MQLFTSRLNLLFRERGDPKTSFDDALDRFNMVLRAQINQPKEVLDDPGRGAISLEIHQGIAVAVHDLSRFLGVVCEVVDVEAWSYS